MTDNQSPIETADQSDAAADLQVQDLPVDDAQQDDVKGGILIGLLLPAVQKVR